MSDEIGEDPGFSWDAEEVMTEERAKTVMSDEPTINQEAALAQEYMRGPNLEDLAEQEEPAKEEDPEVEAKVMNNARLRLEQGRLYEMLLEHNLFENVEASQEAIDNVQREFRKFAKERLEILVGLRMDPKLAHKRSEHQFTPLETDILKRLIAKFSGGISQEIYSPPRQVSGSLKPVAGTARQKSSSAVRTNTQVPSPRRPVNAAPTRTAVDEEPLEKPAYAMKRSELIARSKRIDERQAARKAVPSGRLPTPTPEQTEAIVTAQIINRMQNGKAGVMPLGPLVNKILSSK